MRRKMSNLLVGILYDGPLHGDRDRHGPDLAPFRQASRAARPRCLGLAWGGACMMACILLTGHAPTWSFVAISLVGAGSYGMLGPFWAIPTETLPRSVSGPAMGLVNALGNLGGYFGPLAVGFVLPSHRRLPLCLRLAQSGVSVGAALTLLLSGRPPASCSERLDGSPARLVVQ